MLINSNENIEHARVDIRYRLCCWQEINTVIGLHFKAASDLTNSTQMFIISFVGNK